MTGSLRAGLRAGLLSAAMPGGANFGNAVLNFVADGITGGIFGVLQGGKFGHGFLSSAVGNAMAGAGGSNPYNRVIVSAITGGTISALTGGKFANGAAAAAFATAMREDWGDKSIQSDGGDFNAEGELTGESREAFNKEFTALQEKVSKLELFSGDAAKEDALKWLHENVHPLSVKYDVEINSNLSKALDGRLWRIDSIGTSYNRHGVSINASLLKPDMGRTKWKWGANWHSHARGYNPNFSGDDLRIITRYQSYGLSWHMSYQDSDGGRLVNK